jgi:streptogramin lyase
MRLLLAAFAAAHTFAWPTSVAVMPDGSVLVVENGTGRVARVDAKSHAVTTFAGNIAKAYSVARAPSGALYLSSGDRLLRLEHGNAIPVAHTPGIGPIAVLPNGHVVYTDASRAHEVSGKVLATGLASPHGIATTRTGVVLVSDTGHGRVLRIDPRTGKQTTLIRVGEPRGIDVAADGSIYLVEASAKRVGHYSAAGKRLGSIGPRFGDPYDVSVAPGVVYVVDTAASGTVRRVTATGTTTL